MATPANLVRLCARPSRRLAGFRAATAQQRLLRRPLSTTPWRSAAAKDGDKDGDDEDERVFSNPGQFLKDFLRDENISVEERQLAKQMLNDWNSLPQDVTNSFDTLTGEITELTAAVRKTPRVKKDSFWNDEEPDPDVITDEVGEDDFEEDDMMAMGHAKLEEHREFREYARLAVWEMPLLSRLAKPFEPPADDQVLRFRYTTYMGEFHPADRKVVVEFCPSDLGDLTDTQRLKLKKLAGPRYNPERDIVKMSCERFEHQAQNKRYLGDLVNKMIETAKDPTDTFEDIPLDTRHHKFKPQIKFPKEWYLTEERKKELEAQRREALLVDEQKMNEGAMVDGLQAIQQAMLNAPKVEQMVPVSRIRSPRGRR